MNPVAQVSNLPAFRLFKGSLYDQQLASLSIIFPIIFVLLQTSALDYYLVFARIV